MRQRESRRTSFVLTPSRSERSGLPRSTTRDYGRTIGLKIHTSRYDAENENSSGSSRRVPPNAFFRSTPLSTMLFTSNAIFYRAAPSRRFEPRRLPSGGNAASQPDLGRGEFQPTDSINVSMPKMILALSDQMQPIPKVLDSALLRHLLNSKDWLLLTYRSASATFRILRCIWRLRSQSLIIGTQI